MRRASACDLSFGGLLPFEQAVLNSTHDGGVAHGAVVYGDAVDDGHRKEQRALLDVVQELGVLAAHVVRFHVAIQDLSIIAVPALYLGSDDGRDLLRRPGRASTARPAIAAGGYVEDLDNDGLRHSFLPL